MTSIDDLLRLDTVGLARGLIGCRLWRNLEGVCVGGEIVETEAYLGANDPAAHTRGGLRSPRNESMYLAAGHIYVYFTYGMHHCMNVVSTEQDSPEAVLIRAIEPTTGLDEMRKRRPQARIDRDLTNGPAKLCQALDIDLSLDGTLLNEGLIRLDPRSRQVSDEEIGVSGRIGIANSGVAHWPLRFFLRDSPFVSRR